MDFSMFIKPDMIGFIAGIIILIEIIKVAINKFVQKDTPIWIWKLAVFVLGFASAAVNLWNNIGLRELLILGITYAAVASLLYQTGKLVFTGMKKKPKDDDNTGE